MEDKSLKDVLTKSIQPKVPDLSGEQGKDEASTQPVAPPETTSTLPKPRPQR